MWPFTKQPKIVETKTFSCPGMEGFTFEYPVFEEWGVKVGELSGPVGCLVTYSKNNLDAKISVMQISKPGKPAPGSPMLVYPPTSVVLKNSQDLPYESGENYVQFYLPDFAVKIALASGENGFSPDPFFKTVIDSFRLAGLVNNQEQALQIAYNAIGSFNEYDKTISPTVELKDEVYYVNFPLPKDSKNEGRKSDYAMQVQIEFGSGKVIKILTTN